MLQFVSTRKLWNNILHMTYMWNKKKKSMHWWFNDGGHLLEMLHELVAEIMFRPMNKDKQAMEKRNIN